MGRLIMTNDFCLSKTFGVILDFSLNFVIMSA